jgi:hypothetical protein
MNQLLHVAPVYGARASTKHEPGDKRRALYAVDDIPVLIAAYASQNREKEMTQDGVCARQTPDDWMAWLSASDRRSGYWVSSDYSDYNHEHTMAEQQLIDLVKASIWMKKHTAIGREKALCSLWVALGFSNSWIKFPDVGWQRIISGMYSGSRDTMSFNCDKHILDVHITKDECNRLGYSVRFHNGSSVFVAGDDEDIHFKDLLSAICYGKMLMIIGHDMNPVKQLAGEFHHQFLQCQAYEGSDLQRPLASLIATLASGNWYVPKANWYGGMIGGVSDNYWECCARGMNIVVAQHMAGAFLDTIMRVPNHITKVYSPLEWWDFRSPGYKHPLWGVVTKKPPSIESLAVPTKGWPCNATNAWLETKKHILQGVPQRKIDLYKTALLQMSFGSSFLTYRQQTLSKGVLEIWPKRLKRHYAYGNVVMQASFTMHEMAAFYTKYYSKNDAPRSDEELASRLGIDPQIVNILGAWQSLATVLKGSEWCRFERVVDSHRINDRVNACPWAFRSWVSRLNENAPTLHVTNTLAYKNYKHIFYIYAGNGAGKTWLTNKFGDWLDIDSVSAMLSAKRPRFGVGLNGYTARRLFLEDCLRVAIRQGYYVILGQWAPVEVRNVCSAMHVSIDIVSYEPGVELRCARLAKRGYEDERIRSLMQRYAAEPPVCRTWLEIVQQLHNIEPGVLSKSQWYEAEMKIKNEKKDTTH